MGPLGVPELILIFVLALLLFGPKKLPELGRSFGKGMAEFRRASNELRSTFQREMDAIERENQSVKEAASDFKRQLDPSYYDDESDDYDAPASNGSTAAQESESAAGSAGEQDAGEDRQEKPQTSPPDDTAPSAGAKEEEPSPEATTSAGASAEQKT